MTPSFPEFNHSKSNTGILQNLEMETMLHSGRLQHSDCSQEAEHLSSRTKVLQSKLQRVFW